MWYRGAMKWVPILWLLLLSGCARVDADLARVGELVRDEYYGQVDEEVLGMEEVNELVEALPDRYSRVLSPTEYERLLKLREGVYDGLGLSYDWENGQMSVYQVLPGSIASGAGMLVGDSVVEIEGEKIGELSEGEVEDYLQEERLPVDVVVERAGEQVAMEMQAGEFETRTVEYRYLGEGMGYVKIYLFAPDTAGEIRDAVDQMLVDEVEWLVLDLRGNGGGNSGSSLELANELVPEGFLTHHKSRNEDSVGIAAASGGRLVGQIKQTVVLVDEYTASEAEVLTAALKDNGRASVIGKQTYGKGAVVSLYPLPSGKGLLLVTGEWTRPNLESVEGVGITPDRDIDEITDWSGVAWRSVVGR